MNYKSIELRRNEVLNLFKGYTSKDFDFEVNRYQIPCYKPNYFRIYVDGSENEYFEMFFYNDELKSFGYNRSLYSKNLIDTEYGNYRVLTKIPPAVKKFMEHLVSALTAEDYPYEVSDNAKRFLNFISKLTSQKIEF